MHRLHSIRWHSDCKEWTGKDVEENTQDLISGIILAMRRGTEKNTKITLVWIGGLYAMNFIQYIPSKTQKCQQLNQGSVSPSRSSSVATCHTCSYCITSYKKKNTMKWFKWCYYFDINKVNNKYYILNASVSLITHFLFLSVLLQIILCITNFHF